MTEHTQPRPRLSSLTWLGFQLNGWLQDTTNAEVTFDDVYKGLDSGSLWRILQNKIPGMDVSLLTGLPEEGIAVLSGLGLSAQVMRCLELRK